MSEIYGNGMIVGADTMWPVSTNPAPTFGLAEDANNTWAAYPDNAEWTLSSPQPPPEVSSIKAEVPSRPSSCEYQHSFDPLGMEHYDSCNLGEALANFNTGGENDVLSMQAETSEGGASPSCGDFLRGSLDDLPDDLKNIVLQSPLQEPQEPPLLAAATTTATTTATTNLHELAGFPATTPEMSSAAPVLTSLNQPPPRRLLEVVPPLDIGGITAGAGQSGTNPDCRGRGKSASPGSRSRGSKGGRKAATIQPVQGLAVDSHVIKTEPVSPKCDSPVEFWDGPAADDRKERRREQNRRAARKLREKKKRHFTKMEMDYEEVVKENRKLASEIQQLRSVVSRLESQLARHDCGLQRPPARESPRGASPGGPTSPETIPAPGPALSTSSLALGGFGRSPTRIPSPPSGPCQAVMITSMDDRMLRQR